MKKRSMLWPLALATAPAALVAWGVYHPAAQIFGPTVRRTSRPGTIALTFDDGPNPRTTPRLLDLLDRFEARATFFVLGMRVRAYRAIVRDILARGHAIGNHTDTHPRLIWHGVATIEAELRGCQDAVADATGHRPRLHRPPFGYRHPQLAGAAVRAGLPGIVMWTVMTRDWTEDCSVIDTRCARVRDRDIVVMHDGDYRDPAANRDVTLGALAEWLPRWRDCGWQSVALDVQPGAQNASQTPASDTASESSTTDRASSARR
ncbi:MAG TPA: polysaccharide deacetylase family protein [Vicinamibacterales bacterium]|jgi:peptidoglycan/xylan/chitin deacetylase (PgdA/CDA1 family)